MANGGFFNFREKLYMFLYQDNSGKLTDLNEKPFALEKEIQTLFEQNLTNLTNLKFIKSEFTIKSNRIDTLAFDNETKAFVIIEYKRDKNFSVIDQGVSYLTEVTQPFKKALS